MCVFFIFMEIWNISVAAVEEAAVWLENDAHCISMALAFMPTV